MTIKTWLNTNLGITDHNNQDGEALAMGGKGLIRQLIDRAVSFSADKTDWWGEAYIDSDGRNNSVVAASTTAVFDTNKYKVPITYVIIEATSLTTTDFAINNCQCVLMSTGKWLVYCTTGTEEVKRAQIYKTLFYGTDGSDARIKNTYVTGITALKTSVTRDVGNYAYYAGIGPYGGSGNSTATHTGTYSSTSGNTNVSSWSYCRDTNGTVDETGTDTTADEKTNPADCQVYCYARYNSGTSKGRWSNPNGTLLNTSPGASDYVAYSRAIILSKKTISWVSSTTSWTASVIDFYTTHSVPTMTASSSTDFFTITHTIPTGSFSATPSKVIGTPIVADWETGADIQYKLTNGTYDSGYLTCGTVQEFTAFPVEATTLTVKLVPKSSSPTAGYPSIKGFAIRVTE